MHGGHGARRASARSSGTQSAARTATASDGVAETSTSASGHGLGHGPSSATTDGRAMHLCRLRHPAAANRGGERCLALFGDNRS